MNTTAGETGSEPVPPCPWCGRVTSDVDYKACRTGTGSDALIVHVLIRADCDNPRCPGPAGSAGRLGPAADDGHRARRVS